MIKLKYAGRYPGYLDGFPEDCKRSCKGAIHLLPGRIKEVTKDEWDYIKKAYPELSLVKLPGDVKLKVVKEVKEESKENLVSKKTKKVKASSPVKVKKK